MDRMIFFIILVCSTLFIAQTTDISGLNTSIVVDLKILNEENYSPDIKCPEGYVQASGCEDKCDLNYGTGKNYIYLCQKKKISRSFIR